MKLDNFKKLLSYRGIKFEYQEHSDDIVDFITNQRVFKSTLSFSMFGDNYVIKHFNTFEVKYGVIAGSFNDVQCYLNSKRVELHTIYDDILLFKENNRRYVISQLMKDTL